MKNIYHKFAFWKLFPFYLCTCLFPAVCAGVGQGVGGLRLEVEAVENGLTALGHNDLTGDGIDFEFLGPEAFE